MAFNKQLPPFLTNLQCESALPWKDLTDQLENGLARFSRGEIEQPVRVMLPISEHSGFLGMMPCYSEADDVIACKMVSVYPENTKHGMPSIFVYVFLFDSKTGKLMAVMEGEGITKRRTAATSALSARWLAPKKPTTLAILGSGNQALAHMQVLLDQYGDSITKIKIWNYRMASAIHLAEAACGWLKAMQEIEVFESVEECIADADLIVTATFSSKPVMKASKGLKAEGCHIMAVGAPRPDWAEIEPEVWNGSKVFVDSFGGAKAESGDIIDSKCEVNDELGAFIGKKGDLEGSQRTAFKSLGLAIEDLVAAKMAMSKAGTSSQWPFEFWASSKVSEVAKGCAKMAPIRPKSEATNSVTNLEVKTTLVDSTVLVTEMKTSSATLALLYKARSGELKAIMDINPIKSIDSGLRNAFYIEAYQKIQ